jgi:hypothetical protein
MLNAFKKHFNWDFSEPGRKPTGPVEIDWDNPLARELASVYLFQESGGDVLELVSRRRATNTGIDFQATVHGWEAVPDNNNDDFTLSNSDSGLAASSDLTVFTIAKTTSSGSGRRLLQYGPNLLGTTGGFYFSHTGTAQGQIGLGTASNFQFVSSGNNFWSTTDYNKNSVTLRGTTVKFYKDGTLYTDTSIGAARNTNTDKTMTLFERQDNAAGRNWDSNCRVVYIWKRALSSAQVASLTRDPYQLLKPAVPQTYFVPAAGGATYTLATASGAFTYSGASLTLSASRKIAAGSGTYSYAGTAVDLTYTPVGGPTYTLAIDSAAYSYSGTALSLTAQRSISAGSGAYSYQGTSIAFEYTRRLLAESGSYSYSGTNIAFKASRAITLETAVFTYSGTDVKLTLPSELWQYTGNVTTDWQPMNNSTTSWAEQPIMATTWTKES